MPSRLTAVIASSRFPTAGQGERSSGNEIGTAPVSQESLLFKSNMASLPFVGTLESDDDVDQLDNESDSDEEPEKVYRHCIYTYSPFMPVSERFLSACSLSRERQPRRETDRCLRTTFSSSQENWRIIFKIHGI